MVLLTLGRLAHTLPPPTRIERQSRRTGVISSLDHQQRSAQRWSQTFAARLIALQIFALQSVIAAVHYQGDGAFEGAAIEREP
jgi:hypothetical protein